MGHYSYPLTDRRTRRMERLVEETDVNTKADALDIAIQHYLACLDAWPDAARTLTPEQADAISTPQLSINYYPQVR